VKILIAEDDATSRFMLQKMLERYGKCDIAVDGRQAVESVSLAMEAGQPYDLICLDIWMPEKDGHEALQEIRAMEHEKGTDAARIVMTTALKDTKNMSSAYGETCDGYLVKPIDTTKLLNLLKDLQVVA
jgi:two-component system chemotaxis response regulator CheY